MNESSDDQYSPEEIARRRDAGLLRALKTPPKLHSEMVGKSKRAKARQQSRVKKPRGR
jgi:hypothetical protein